MCPCCRVGHHALFHSERSVLFRSFKEHSALFRTFFKFLATYETLNVLLAVNSNQFWHWKHIAVCMPGLRSDPSLLTVWSFYRACLRNIYLEAANPYLPDSHVILDLLADQLISSSGIIFQGNSTKHCPSWDLLCQDFKGKFLSVTRRLVLAYQVLAQSINYHITMISSCIIYPFIYSYT